MSEIILRDYQQNLVNKIETYIDNGGKRSVLVLPTGGGKTIIFSYIAGKYNDLKKKVLVITHRKELLMQADGSFQKFGINAGFIVANNMNIPYENVVVSMVETLHRRVSKKEQFRNLLHSFELIIIDELHRGEFNKLFEYFTKDQVVLGFTATSYRKSPQKPLSDFYDNIIHGPQVKELISKGHLVRSIAYGTKLDMRDIGVRGGEYKAEDQEEAFEAQQLYSACVKNYEKIIPGKKTIVFCPSVESSVTLVNHFNNAGIAAAHVDGNTSKGERDTIFEMFRDGDIDILSNVEIATTGLDIPSIEAVILFLATRSLIKYLQAIGRCSRPYEGKTHFTILDFGNNVARFGFYDDDRKWSLELDTTRFLKEPNMTKDCPSCGALCKIFDRECPECGFKFSGEEIRGLIKEEIQIELEPLTSYTDLIKFLEGKSYLEIDIVREIKGYRDGWVIHQMHTERELKEYAEAVNKKWLVKWAKEKLNWKPRSAEEIIQEHKEWVEQQRFNR